jgi:hypothetical protein
VILGASAFKAGQAETPAPFVVFGDKIDLAGDSPSSGGKTKECWKTVCVQRRLLEFKF